MSKIIVKHVYSYGNDRYYPICEVSKLLCELMGRKSLTSKQLDLIRNNEWEVIINEE